MGGWTYAYVVRGGRVPRADLEIARARRHEDANGAAAAAGWQLGVLSLNWCPPLIHTYLPVLAATEARVWSNAIDERGVVCHTTYYSYIPLLPIIAAPARTRGRCMLGSDIPSPCLTG